MPFPKSPAAPAPRNAGNSQDAGRASGCHFNVIPLHRGVAPTADELLKAASDFPDLYAAFRPDPIEELRAKVALRPVVTLPAKLVVAAVWVVCVGYCAAIWMGIAS